VRGIGVGGGGIGSMTSIGGIGCGYTSNPRS